MVLREVGVPERVRPARALSTLGAVAGARFSSDQLAAPALVIAALTVLGILPRIVVVQESISADELSTYWIVSTNGLAGVVETVHSAAEITPPLSFIAAWITTRFGLAPELLRLSSLLAGVATIPLVYVLGQRTVGSRAGVVAAAMTAASPFMIFYSGEARGYALLMVLAVLSTLALLAAVDDERRRWWVAYAALSCAAAYTHYTAIFVLGAQFLWVLWACPGKRRAAVLANAGAVVGFLPWLSGLLADLESPTTDILAALTPFTPSEALDAIGHWAIGYPYSVVSLGSLPGPVALVLIGVGVTTAAVAWTVRGGHRSLRPPPRLALVVALALAAPVAEALVSLVSTDIFVPRNLAVSWPAAALALGALVVVPTGALRLVASALVLGGLAVGAVKMFDSQYQRPDFEAAADLIERNASPSTRVIDAALLTPGPLSPIDIVLDDSLTVVRAGAPQQRTRPFSILDTVPTTTEVVREATDNVPDRLVLLDANLSEGCPSCGRAGEAVASQLSDDYRLVSNTTLEGSTIDLSVLVFKPRAHIGTDQAS